MGTSGAWGGSGTAAANAMRQVIGAAGSDGGSAETNPSSSRVDPSELAAELRRLANSRTATTTRPGGSRVAAGSANRRSQSTGFRGGGGAKRTASKTARSAARAITGAIAYQAGDRRTLESLGLNLDELRGLSPFEVIRRIVDMACGTPESTVADHERRLITADLAERLITDDGASTLDPSDVAAAAVAIVIAEVILSECEKQIIASDGDITESVIRDLGEAIVDRMDIDAAGFSESELSAAIETGLQDIKEILGLT